MNRPTKWMVLGALVVLCLLIASASAWASLSAETARVFKSQRGDEVVLVALKPQSDENYLVRFAGTSSVLDGLALPCKHSIDGNHEYFTTSWRGREFSFVQMDRRGDHWELYVPGELNHSRALKLDEALTKSISRRRSFRCTKSSSRTARSLALRSSIAPRSRRVRRRASPRAPPKRRRRAARAWP